MAVWGRRGTLGYTLGMMLSCSVAQAQVGWDFSGFASVGAGRVSKEGLTYMDYTSDWSVDSDSMLGLQLIVTPLERVSVTGQVVARGYNVENDRQYQPEIEWLFVGYEISSDIRLRAGRLRTPHYLFSESLEIGYSYPWARPPVDMYVPFIEPFSHFDGADISYQTTLGEVDAELKAFYGQMAGDFLGISIDVTRVMGVVASARWDDVTLRYGVNTNRTDLNLPNGQEAIDGFTLAESFDTAFAGISDNFFDDNQEFQYHGLGFQWERDTWTVTAEKFLFVGPKQQFSLDSRGWYISLGRQFGSWMPYTVVGDYKTRIDSRMQYAIADTYGKYPAGGQSDLEQALDGLRAGALFAYEERNVAQRSNTLGVRWDFHPNADLKFEIQYFDFQTNSTGHMLPADSKHKASDAVTTAIIMDVVF